MMDNWQLYYYYNKTKSLPQSVRKYFNYKYGVLKCAGASILEALVNNSMVESSSITLGNTINITGSASGGIPPYTYEYFFKQASQSVWSKKNVSNTVTSTTVKPGSAVTYNIKVVIKDSAGNTESKIFDVEVKAPLTNNSKMESTSIKLGSTINITGSATGGTAPYKYSYYYKQASSSAWFTKLANTSLTSTTVKPTVETVYNIKVVVEDSTGKTAEKIFDVNVTAAE